MNCKKILLITLLLSAILTLGAVSAADDADALAVDDVGDAMESPIDESEDIALEADGDSPQEKYNVTMEVNRPDEVCYGDEIYISADLRSEDDQCSEAPSGKVILYLNDEQVSDDSAYDPFFYYGIEDFGVYNFKIEYSGDDNFNPTSQEFTYNVTSSSYHIDIHYDVSYDTKTIVISNPIVLNPKEIVLTVNGTKYQVFDDYSGDYVADGSELVYGVNVVNVYYPGDEKFGEYSRDENVTLYSAIKWEEKWYSDWSEPVEIYLNVSADVSGTLDVYSVSYDEEDYEIHTKIASAIVKDGVARIEMNDLPIGSHEIYANFTGSVPVRELRFNINVRPKIRIPNLVFTNGESYITVEVSEGTGGRLDVYCYEEDEYGEYDYDNGALLDSRNITGNMTKFSLSGLNAGIYVLEVTYTPEGQDEYSFSKSERCYVIDKYDANLTIAGIAENVVVNNQYVYVSFDLARYAQGNITVYVDGKEMERFEVDEFESYAYFNASGLTLGEHTVSLNFTNTYGNSSDSAKFNVVSGAIYIPDSMDVNSEHVSSSNIEVRVSENAKGTISILIDNEAYITEAVDALADDKEYYIYFLADNLQGKHNVCVTYDDDVYGKSSLNKTVSFGYQIRAYAECVYGEDNIITAYLPDDLNMDALTVTVDGNKMNYVRNRNGIEINPSKLSIGNHTVIISYAGDAFYPARDFNRTFEVYPYVTFPEHNILLGSEEGIYLILPEDAKGKMNVTLTVEYRDDEGDWEYRIFDSKLISFENGKAYYSCADLPADYYYVSVSYTGDDYAVEDATRGFTVTAVNWGKYYSDLGENKTIEFVSKDKEPGQLRIILSKIVDEDKEWDDPVNVYQTVNVTLVDGRANYTFTGLPVGYYYVFLAEEYIGGGLKGYQGSDDFYVAAPFITSTASKYSIGNITPMVIELPEDANGKATVTVYANYSSSNPSAFKTFEVTVKGKISVDLNEIISGPGDYGVSVNYTGNYGHFVSNSGEFKVTDSSKMDADIKAVARENVKEGDDVVINITSPVLATGKITVTVDGKDYPAVVKAGKSSVVISGLKAGTYNAEVKFEGDSKYANKTVVISITVQALADPVIKAKDTSVLYSANGKYSVTVYGSDGNLASGVEVIFEIAKKQVGKATTDSNGVATYTVKNVPATYKISATALGKTVTKKLTVKHVVTLKTATLKKSAKKLTLQATLAKVNGKYLKGKTITFKINGKKVASAKTNKKGIAKVTIKNPSVVKKLKAGKKATYQATYQKDTVKKTAKVKK